MARIPDAELADLARNAGLEVLPGKVSAVNPATRYYLPGWGRSWTPENPLTMSHPRALLGLPKQNSDECVTCAEVAAVRCARVREAPDGNPGGGPEWLFTESGTQLQHMWTVRMEPPL